MVFSQININVLFLFSQNGSPYYRVQKGGQLKQGFLAETSNAGSGIFKNIKEKAVYMELQNSGSYFHVGDLTSPFLRHGII